MDFIYLLLCFTAVSVTFVQSFFLFKDKFYEPFFYCWKVCPLYCQPRRKRDVEAVSSIEWSVEDWSYSPYHHDDDHDPYPPFYYHRVPHYYCHHTTEAPTTTTTKKPEPPDTFICLLCKEKCHYPPDPPKKDKK